MESLATGEFELAAEAHGSLKLLEEDGTTAVFPDFVIEVRDDLKKVGRRLQKHQTDKATQAMQKEIIDMLEMLIDALRQQIEQNEQNGGEP
jgi:molecular chaperone GrpE (heat shock protein)